METLMHSPRASSRAILSNVAPMLSVSSFCFDVSVEILTCGAQTGGNFAGFQSLMPHYYDLSYPIAEIAKDGTAIIRKHANQNGL